MRILLWHGYLLSGSGSNIYTRSIAREWRKHGHHVVCMCQERHPEDFDWIDAASLLGPGEAFQPAAAEDGSCELVRPEIGDVLPVYVFDEYEGTTAKRFVDLTDQELARYNEMNVAAMREVIRGFRPDAIITGHEVMGPHIAAHACDGQAYVAKLHGSALEYAVKEDVDRFLPYATEGLSRARSVTGGSEYMLKAAAAVIPGWADHGVVVNPGVDIELFRPAERPPNSPRVVGFVGKLIANKGVQDLLVALGLLAEPVEVVIVGFGDMEDRLRVLADAIARRDLDGARASLRSDDPREAPALALLDGPEGASIIERASRSQIRFTGRLEHGPLSQLLPTFDVLVVPSVLAEAFGMVAAEAAACAVVPIVPDHSGIGEVGRTLEREIGRAGALTYAPEERAGGIAARIGEIVALDDAELGRLGRSVCEVARSRWTWEQCGSKLLALATGASLAP